MEIVLMRWDYTEPAFRLADSSAEMGAQFDALGDDLRQRAERKSKSKV